MQYNIIRNDMYILKNYHKSRHNNNNIKKKSICWQIPLSSSDSHYNWTIAKSKGESKSILEEKKK